MPIEEIKQLNLFDDKYHKEDYIREIFAGDDRGEIEKIQQVHNLTDEQIKIFTYYARLRKTVIDSRRKEINKRKNGNLALTEEELLIGCRLEEIEPQVRDAVIKMNKKGYATIYSGFHHFDSQVIKFKTKAETNISLEQIEEKYKAQGVRIKADSESIEIIFSQEISLEEIKKIWDEIAVALPDLGGTARE